MVYILLGTGFEETEAVAPCDVLRRAGVDVRLVGLNGREIRGSNGITLCADLEPEAMELEQMDMIVLPGGLGGVASIRASRAAMHAVEYAWENGKYVAAICAAPTVLAALGITDGHRATCYPGQEPGMGAAVLQPGAAAVVDGRIITGMSAGTALDFGLQLVRALRGEQAAQQVAAQIVYRR